MNAIAMDPARKVVCARFLGRSWSAVISDTQTRGIFQVLKLNIITDSKCEFIGRGKVKMVMKSRIPQRHKITPSKLCC